MSDFVDFCRAHGLIIDHAIADGRWHRTRTEDKPRKRNGAYVLDDRGGAVRNYATMETFATWRNTSSMPVTQRVVRRIDDGRHERARIAAQALIRRAQLVRPRETVRRAGAWIEGEKAHPYLAGKGFPNEPGLVVDGCLLVPMYDLRGTLVGAQTISADGKKLFLPGTKAKGAVHVLGTSGDWYLCEGYATGLSVRDALARMYRRARVAVCFSAENLRYVASLLTGSRVVVADNDASGTGERIAQATGLPYVMPDEVGSDANDLHRSRGIGAVMQMLKQPVMEPQ